MFITRMLLEFSGSPAALLLIAGVAMQRSGTRTCGGSDGGTFKCASRLVTDDAAGGRAKKSAGGGSALGVGAGRCGAVRKGEGRGGTGDDKNDVLHGVLDCGETTIPTSGTFKDFQKIEKFRHFEKTWHSLCFIWICRDTPGGPTEMPRG